MTIEVLGIDWDSCLASSHMALDQLVSGNKSFLKYNMGNYKYVFLSSARQTQLADRFNSNNNKNALAIRGIQRIADHADIPFIPLLMGDLKRLEMNVDLPLSPGYPIGNEARDVNSCDGELFDCLLKLSDGKQALVYFETQFIANVFPNEQINYTFVDDRPDVLKDVESYFRKFPELIPANVTVKFGQKILSRSRGVDTYTGNILPSVQGTGFVDAAFMQTTLQMMKLSDDKSSGCHPFRLGDRVAKVAPPPGSLQEADERLNIELRGVINTLYLVWDKIIGPYNVNMGRELRELILALPNELMSYYDHRIDRDTLKKNCFEAIEAFTQKYPTQAPIFDDFKNRLEHMHEGLDEKVATFRHKTLKMIEHRAFIHLEMELRELAVVFAEDRSGLYNDLEMALKQYNESQKSEEDLQRFKQKCIDVIGAASTLVYQKPEISPLLQQILLTLTPIGGDNQQLMEVFASVRLSEKALMAVKFSQICDSLEQSARSVDEWTANHLRNLRQRLIDCGCCMNINWESWPTYVDSAFQALKDTQKVLGPLKIFKEHADKIYQNLQMIATDRQQIALRDNFSQYQVTVEEPSLARFQKEIIKLNTWGDRLDRTDRTASAAAKKFAYELKSDAAVYFKSKGDEASKQQFIRSFQRATAEAKSVLAPYSEFQFMLFNILTVLSTVIGVGIGILAYNKWNTGSFLCLQRYRQQAIPLAAAEVVCQSLMASPL